MFILYCESNVIARSTGEVIVNIRPSLHAMMTKHRQQLVHLYRNNAICILPIDNTTTAKYTCFISTPQGFQYNMYSRAHKHTCLTYLKAIELKV